MRLPEKRINSVHLHVQLRPPTDGWLGSKPAGDAPVAGCHVHSGLVTRHAVYFPQFKPMPLGRAREPFSNPEMDL